MSHTQRGFIKKIHDTEQKTDTFSVRVFELRIPGAYEQLCAFQTVQDRCSILDRFSHGDEVDVHFDIRGNEYNGKVFNNLNAWKVEAVNTTAAPPAPRAPKNPADDDLPFPETAVPADDDLPF